jgi:hypothetical protein
MHTASIVPVRIPAVVNTLSSTVTTQSSVHDQQRGRLR